MDPVILTSRLKLTLITTAEIGSPELEWVHELFSDKDATWWSILGQSKSTQDSQSRLQNFIPKPAAEGHSKSFKIAYAVHKLLDPEESESKADFIGLVNLVSAAASPLVLPDHLILPASENAATETLILSYSFLPRGWGKGFATESVGAVLDFCKSLTPFWEPFAKVYIRVIVNDGNPASLRVMGKLGIQERGIFKWTGKVWLAGGWRFEDDLHIFGKYLIE
ncbi:hypothetical protein BLS_005945 [Venturia inaequalis]|uniref:N-acetyltransferase domain-containing protein n=1 Tax=Venturia inaequalis TaxID=5025 RepID=A0A8H3UET1_VENIN|nr:hypothetical protein BLS_005945 [Venturia inaequalis]RDI77953.1 hypothetical protein Vi05172_g12030 [Venturia inaequalis]